MPSTFVVALVEAFFIVSVIASAIAIYELNKARKVLSETLLKKAISWMINASFILAVMSAAVGVNYMLPLVPELASILQEYHFITAINVLIWLAIACNIMAALSIREIGKTFGFKEDNSAEMFFEKYLFGKEKK